MTLRVRIAVCALLGVVAIGLGGCPPSPPPPPKTASSGTITVSVAYTAPKTWAYTVTDTGTPGFDRLSIDLAQPCATPTLTVTPATATPVITPASGPAKSWAIDYRTPVGTDTVTFVCDGVDGGVASVRVLTTAPPHVSGPNLTPIDGPK